MKRFFPNSLKNSVVVALFTAVPTFFLIFQLNPLLGGDFPLFFILLMLAIPIHELGHFYFLRRFKIRWVKIFKPPLFVGFNTIGGKISPRNFFIALVSGTIVTIPLAIFSIWLLPMLLLSGLGDLLTSFEIFRHSPKMVEFKPKGVVLDARN